MVISLSSLKSIRQSILELSPETEMLTDNKRTSEQTELHQFWKEPSYDGDKSHCQVWMLTDKQTNECMKLLQFRKEPSYDSDLSPCQVWIWFNKAFSS